MFTGLYTSLINATFSIVEKRYTCVKLEQVGGTMWCIARNNITVYDENYKAITTLHFSMFDRISAITTVDTDRLIIAANSHVSSLHMVEGNGEYVEEIFKFESKKITDTCFHNERLYVLLYPRFHSKRKNSVFILRQNNVTWTEEKEVVLESRMISLINIVQNKIYIVSNQLKKLYYYDRSCQATRPSPVRGRRPQ